jgi:hypothetical protein
MATSKKSVQAGPAGKGLQVTARRASFWRGGYQFSAEPRVLALADLTPEQAQAIRDEGDGGMLVVAEVDLD